jgi:CheY-like chemotaxis protein
LQPLTIALIDDHLDTRNILELTLKDQYQVRAYSNAHDAFAEMKKDKPDLVIADMLLRDGLGTDLVRWMRADPILRKTPAIVITGLPFDEHFAAAGFQSFLQKPVDYDELIQVIEKSIGDSRSASLIDVPAA